MPTPNLNRLTALREAADLLPVDVASRLRVTERTVYRWERGESAIPDRHKLSLAEMFGVSVSWLMRWEDNGNGNGDGGRQERAA